MIAVHALVFLAWLVRTYQPPHPEDYLDYDDEASGYGNNGNESYWMWLLSDLSFQFGCIIWFYYCQLKPNKKIWRLIMVFSFIAWVLLLVNFRQSKRCLSAPPNHVWCSKTNKYTLAIKYTKGNLFSSLIRIFSPSQS